MPTGLSERAQQIWEDLAPIAVAMATLTVADVKAFSKLCELEATFEMAIAEKSREEFTPFLVSTVIDGAGNERQKVEQHPAIRLERDTAAAVKSYYDYFGLTPTGRAKISVHQKDEPQSKWAGIL